MFDDYQGPDNPSSFDKERDEFDFYCATGDCSDQCDPCREDCPGPQERATNEQKGETPRVAAVTEPWDRLDVPDRERIQDLRALACQLERELETLGADARRLWDENMRLKAEAGTRSSTANRIVCPYCNPVLNTANPAPDASEPAVPNGEYRELQLGGSGTRSATSFRWHPVSEQPQDEEPLFVVRDADGQCAFAVRYEGKWEHTADADCGEIAEWIALPRAADRVVPKGTS